MDPIIAALALVLLTATMGTLFSVAKKRGEGLAQALIGVAVGWLLFLSPLYFFGPVRRHHRRRHDRPHRRAHELHRSALWPRAGRHSASPPRWLIRYLAECMAYGSPELPRFPPRPAHRARVRRGG